MADVPPSPKRRTGKRLSVDFTGNSFFAAVSRKASGNQTANSNSDNPSPLDSNSGQPNYYRSSSTNSPSSSAPSKSSPPATPDRSRSPSRPSRLKTFIRTSPLKPLPTVPPPMPVEDESTAADATTAPDDKKNSRKKGRFKSLDIRRYKPKILQQLQNNAGGFSLRSSLAKKQPLSSDASNPSSPIPPWKNLHKELPMRPPMSTHGSFASLRGGQSASFSPGSTASVSSVDMIQNTSSLTPNLTAAEVKAMLSSEYKVNQLNVRMEVKGTVRFRFTEKELLYCRGDGTTTDGGGDEFVEYDIWPNIIVVDTGRLMDSKHNAFQLQSENQGIRIYEAATPGDKLNILSLAQYLSATDRGSTDIDGEEMYDSMDNEENALGSIERPQDENLMILMQMQNTLLSPTVFASIRKRRKHLVGSIEAEIEDRSKEVKQILGHMDRLKENANALGEDLILFEQQSSRRQQNLQTIGAQLTDMANRADMMYHLIRENKEPEVTENFPEMLDQLDRKLVLLRLRVQQKQRITIVMAISLLMLIVIIVKFILAT